MSLIPSIKADLAARKTYAQSEDLYACAMLAFEWADEKDSRKRASLAQKYYERAGYDAAQVSLKLDSGDQSTPVFAQPEPHDEISLKCCENPKPLMLMEHTICDNCKVQVAGTEILMANYTDVSVSAPNKVFVLEEAATGTSAVSRLKAGSRKPDNDTVSQTSVQAQKRPRVWNRWGGIQKLLLILHGQKSADYSKRWGSICASIQENLGIKAGDTEAARNVRYVDLYNALPDIKTKRDGPVIWEAFTGSVLPQIPAEILWVIEHVICKEMYERDLKDLEDIECNREMHKLTPATVLSKILRLWPMLEPMYQFPDAQRGNVSVIKLNEYWDYHCKAAGWKSGIQT